MIPVASHIALNPNPPRRGCKFLFMNLHGFFKKPSRPDCKPSDAITKQDLRDMERAIVTALAGSEQRIISGIGVTFEALKEMENKLMATQDEIVKQLNETREQLRKVSKEQSDRSDALLKKITDLEAIIAAGGTIGQDLVDAAAGVKAEAQALDDLIPDPPTEQPTAA